MTQWIAKSAAALAFAVSAFAAAQAQVEVAERTVATEPALQQGKDIYARWCTPCHAAEAGLAGTMSLQAKYEGRIPAALEDRTDLTPELIAYFVRNGVAWMPPFRPTEVSDAELAELSRYLTAPPDRRGMHAMLLAEEMVQMRGDTQ